MVMTMLDALETVREVLSDQWPTEQRRLDRIAQALRASGAPGAFKAPKSIPDDAPPILREEIARTAETNYLPLILDTFQQVMKVTGYQTATADAMSTSWADWQRNGMDARQTGIHRSALAYGAAYAMVSAHPVNGLPVIRGLSPRRCAALYDDAEVDPWPRLALIRTDRQVILVDDDAEYRFDIVVGAQSISPISINLSYATGSLSPAGGPVVHGLGHVPVVRYRDRMLLDGEEQLGIIEPLIAIGERITDYTYKMSVSVHMESFRQRVVYGFLPESEEEYLKASSARIWYFEQLPADVKVDALPTGDPTNFLDPRNSAIRDLGAIAQLPVQTFGIDGISNISDATLAGLENAKNQKSGEMKTSLGESHEQTLRLCGEIRGDAAAAQDYESEVQWEDFEPRSFAAAVDGLVKLTQAQILPPEMALEMVPGMTQQSVRRGRALLKRLVGAAQVKALIGRGSGANVTG